jgi:putative inorganic carbon (HCO3(-)) transporter
MFNEASSTFFSTPKRTALFVATLALFTGLIVYKFDVVAVLAAVLAAAAMALIFANTEIATLTVIFVLYTNLAVVLTKFHNVPQPVAGAVFLLLAIPLTNILLIRREPILINRIFWLMLVQLVVMIVSAFFSEYAWPAMGRVLIYLVEGIVLYFLILNTVRSEEMLRKAVWTVVLAGFLMGSLSLLQQVSGSMKTFGGLAQIHVDRLESDTSNGAGKNVAQSGRASGTVGEENYYAQIMLMVLPLAASRFWFERTWLLRIMGALACIPIAGAIMLTFSRGAFVSACAVVMAMVYLGCIKIRHLLMLGLAFVLVVPLIMPQYAYRILTIFRIVGVQPDGGSGKTLDTSMRGRATENLAALNIFLDHPILGVGPGQTQMYTAKYGDEEGITRLQGTRQAHNMYLGVLADTGVIGFLSLMPIFIFSLVGLMRVRRLYSETRPELVGLAIGLTLSLVAFLSSAVFLSAAYERFYWLIVALGAVAVQIAAREEEDPLAQPSLV